MLNLNMPITDLDQIELGITRVQKFFTVQPLDLNDRNARYLILRYDNNEDARKTLEYLAYLIEPKSPVTADDIKELIKIADETTKRKLEQLKDEGLIIREDNDETDKNSRENTTTNDSIEVGT